MDLNKRFAELAGICWHELDGSIYHPLGCSCGHEPYTDCENPDFSSPIEVLRVMKARKDWAEFVDYLKMFGQAIIVPASMPTCIDFHYLYIDLLLTPGALRNKAIEWMEGKDRLDNASR